MELTRGVYVLFSYITTLMLFVNCERHARVRLVENAPEYGTYPHKTSNDIYMDPCKACKFFHTVIISKLNAMFEKVVNYFSLMLLIKTSITTRTNMNSI